MAKALLSSSLLPALPGAAGGSRSAARPMLLPPLRLRRGRRGASACEVRAGLHGLDSVGGPHLQAALERAEAALYTLADAAVAAADTAAGAGADAGQAAAVQKNSGWFGFISEALEVVLKVLKDGLSAVHVPYSYGFAIILLTIIVKAATLPLTKKQVESTLAMQNLQPQIKAIQQRYAGNQERIQLETARLYKQAGVNPLAGCFPTLATIPVWIGLYQALSNVANEGLLTEGFFWIPSLGGPTTIAARQSGSGITWLFPFVDGHPPLGWHDTICYLVLPVLLVASQYVSMEIMKPPQSDDPSQKNTMLILKFLPFMIGWFSLSVPSGLSIYWFTNNVLSTAQQVWLRKMGGAKPVVTEGDNLASRFRQLKEEENRRKFSKALAAGDSDASSSTYDMDDEESDETIEEVLFTFFFHYSWAW
uniref:Membrane insertase YidC/Oxa/ALB C-terminal domain-containing protein n=1 Tax=Zea mays TaxID=4577 RepID=A0A804MZZ5_MAIZE